jgi:hypothetical protein
MVFFLNIRHLLKQKPRDVSFWPRGVTFHFLYVYCVCVCVCVCVFLIVVYVVVLKCTHVHFDISLLFPKKSW